MNSGDQPIKSFFELKRRLDQKAKQEGKLCAAPKEVYPGLREALDEAFKARSLRNFVATEEETSYLLNAARNMAVFAVRENDPGWIRSGVLAVLASRGGSDPREALINLALLNHSSRKLADDLKRIVAEVAPVAPAEIAELVESFVARSETSKSLEAFGYKEVQRRDGFDYKCDW